MQKVTRFDKGTAQVVGDGAIKALAEYAKGLGLSVQGKGGSFDGSGGSFTLRVGFALLQKDGKPFDQAAEDFRRDAFIYDLQPSDLGAAFNLHGERYTVVGLNPRKRLRPILIARARDGKRFCLSAEDTAKKLRPMASLPTAQRRPLIQMPNPPADGGASDHEAEVEFEAKS